MDEAERSWTVHRVLQSCADPPNERGKLKPMLYLIISIVSWLDALCWPDSVASWYLGIEVI